MPPRKKSDEQTLEEQTAGQEPTTLRFSQDGSVLPPAGFGGPGGPVEGFEPVEHHGGAENRGVAQEFGDPSGYAHKTWAPGAVKPGDESELGDSEGEKDHAGSDDDDS